MSTDTFLTKCELLMRRIYSFLQHKYTLCLCLQFFTGKVLYILLTIGDSLGHSNTYLSVVVVLQLISFCFIATNTIWCFSVTSSWYDFGSGVDSDNSVVINSLFLNTIKFTIFNYHVGNCGRVVLLWICAFERTILIVT